MQNTSTRRALRCVLAAAAAAAFAAGCGTPETTPAQGGCLGGKCDSASLSSRFKDLFSDMRQVDLGDLVSVAAGLATREINDQLDGLPYADIKLGETELYATSQRAQNDLTLHDIDQLKAGLVSRYGDDAFITRVNALRAGYLAQNPDKLFAESRFRIGGTLAARLPFEAGGLAGRLGFSGAKAIEATLIAAYGGERSAVTQGPLRAMKALRGFILPAEIDDISKMVPGESLTLSSPGVVGLNVGVGVPIYLGTVVDTLTLHAVVSAAARATIGGQLDIQVIRTEGQTVTVDVGVTGQTSKSVRLAVDTRWGVEGLADAYLTLGPLDINLEQIAQDALEKLLNRKLSTAGAAFENSSVEQRHTVARFVFDLAQRDSKLDQALIQALRGDIRLAQALANRQAPGVTQTLDLTRDARSHARYFGVHFLGMEFYRQKRDVQGAVVINNGQGQSQQLLFDELEKKYGFFFTHKGFKRRALVSIRSDRGRIIDADYNLRLQVREKDEWGAHDQILDHVDPLLARVIGPYNLIQRIAPITDAAHRYVDSKCGAKPVRSGSPHANNTYQSRLRSWQSCISSLKNDPTVLAARESAHQELDNIIATGIPGGYDGKFDTASKMARALLELKLAVQTGYEYPALLTGPEMHVLTDFRLSRRAIEGLLTARDGVQRYATALRNVLWLLHVDRARDAADKLRQVNKKLDKLDGDAARVTAQVAWAGRVMGQLDSLARLSYRSQRGESISLRDRAHLILVGADGHDGLATIAERKSQLTVQMFDAMLDAAGGLDVPKHEAVAYSLLNAVESGQLEMLIKMDFGESKYTDLPDVRLYARGAQCTLIDAGEFSIDSLVTSF
ncbi:MAG: hypothetical protein KC503_25370 [Myxococcales bacterium]|nr:hypothetical protein [Myxococcales bacterium]